MGAGDQSAFWRAEIQTVRLIIPAMIAIAAMM